MNDYTEMTIETYLAERLTKEIAAYEKKSHFHLNCTPKVRQKI
ncbi:hypothetical protein SGADD02_02303 [Streptococcus gallolyticus]|uniref:Uncharacterized protein n=1 Tax=Streptococcus gallolyticus TaxID=315405 RepID=A0A139M662_9STRE|nr:hypothetical protein [Streptococcus gallolyticus]KXT59230.1 hypothetical protein SGADD02_02303 [Streptococcus gallolyticus]